MFIRVPSWFDPKCQYSAWLWVANSVWRRFKAIDPRIKHPGLGLLHRSRVSVIFKIHAGHAGHCILGFFFEYLASQTNIQSPDVELMVGSRPQRYFHPQLRHSNKSGRSLPITTNYLHVDQAPQLQNPFFPLPASSMPSPTLLAPPSTPFPIASKASPTGFPALPVTPVNVCPVPRPAAPTMPPAVLATPETSLPKVEVTKLIGLLLSFGVGISIQLAPCGIAVEVMIFCYV